MHHAWARRFAAALFVLSLGATLPGAEGASYDESVHGDLSNSRTLPSALTLDPGSNVIKGAFGAGDLDYLTVTVPPGLQLSSVLVGNGTVFGGIRSFIGVDDGPVMSVLPNAGSAAGMLGWTHFDFGQFGQNILDDMGSGFGADGFTPPLPAGSYTFWIQETSAAAGSKFELDFQVTAAPAVPVAVAVPVLPPWGIVVLGCVLAWLAIHRLNRV